MNRCAGTIVVFFLVVSTAAGAETRIRPGQIDFSEGIDEDLNLSKDLIVEGTAFAEVISVTGEVEAGGRLKAGDEDHSLELTIGAAAFNAMIGSSSDSNWLYDGVNFSASPRETGVLLTGILSLWVATGTRVYQVVIHGVFFDDDSEHQIRARMYKQRIFDPGNPIPLTSESVQDGGTAGPFSITLTPDYVIEDGYACVVWVRLKNNAAKKIGFFGIEVILRETQY